MTAYLNGTKWCDLGPKPDLRFLYVLAAIAIFFSGGACGQPITSNTAPPVGWRPSPHGTMWGSLYWDRDLCRYGCPPHTVSPKKLRRLEPHPYGWHKSFDGFVYPPATAQWRALDHMPIH